MSGQEVIVRGQVTITCVDNGDAAIVSVSGEVDLYCAEVVENVLNRALNDGNERVIVDLGALEFIDSTGIAVLLRAIEADELRQSLWFIPSQASEVARVLDMTGVSESLRLVRPSPAQTL
jgi:anti-sigma B factor antagonist